MLLDGANVLVALDQPTRDHQRVMIEEHEPADPLKESREAVAFLQGRGSDADASRDLLTIVGYKVSAQALGKAFSRVKKKTGPMTNDLLDAIERMRAKLAGATGDAALSPSARTVERIDPYASRPAAMPLIRDLVARGRISQAVCDAIERVTLKTDEIDAYADEMAWVERAFRMQKKLAEIEAREAPTDPPVEDPAEDPDAPAVAPEELEETARRPRQRKVSK